MLFAWPARPPDLYPLDFHLWGHLKSIVHATSIEHAEILRDRTEQGFRQIRETPGTIERVTRWMTRRVQACLQMQGGQFSSIFCQSDWNRKFIVSHKRRQIGHILIRLFFIIFRRTISSRSYETPCIWQVRSQNFGNLLPSEKFDPSLRSLCLTIFQKKKFTLPDFFRPILPLQERRGVASISLSWLM